MEILKKFFGNYTMTAHSVAGVFALFSLAFVSVPQFHDLVMKLYNYFPAILKEIVGAALALYMWYRNNLQSVTTPSVLPAKN